MGKEVATIVIDEDVLDNFKRYCKLNAFDMNAKIELMIKKDLAKRIKEPVTLYSFFKEIIEKEQMKKQESQEDTQHELKLETYTPKASEEIDTQTQEDYKQQTAIKEAAQENIPKDTTDQTQEILPIQEPADDTTQEMSSQENHQPDPQENIQKAEEENKIQEDTQAENENIQPEIYDSDVKNDAPKPNFNIPLEDNPKLIDPSQKVPTIDELMKKKSI